MSKNTWYYRYRFSVSLLVNAVLVAYITLSIVRGAYSKTSPVAEMQSPSLSGPGDQFLPGQYDETIVSLNSYSISVTKSSGKASREAASTYVVDANTEVYSETPKDGETIAKEQTEYQKELNVGTLPLAAPLPYTLKAAKFSDLKTGMRVSVEYKQIMSAVTTESTAVARRILIESNDSPAATATH
jgi:hypothetical protein